MNFLKHLENIVKWIGPLGITISIIIATSIWFFYDATEDVSRLSIKETFGLMLFSILVTSIFKALYLLIKYIFKKENKNV